MSGGSGGGGGGIGWVGQGHGIIGSYLLRRRAKRQMTEAVEAHMAENGIPIPPRPLSQGKVFTLGFLCGLFLGLLIGLVFWELT